MQAMREAKRCPAEVTVLFEDEASFYRQPTQGWLWSWMGRKQPQMRYSHRSNTRMRVVGFLELCTGKVLSWDMSRVTVEHLAQCIQGISTTFADKKSIYLVWDNWPVHSHPFVQKALQKDRRIHVLPLPTYAPWLNAIEKLWRLVRQHVSHAHPWCDDFVQFREAIRHKLAEYSQGSTDLLYYVGLSK